MATKATPSMAIAEILSRTKPMTKKQARDVRDQIKISSDNTWDLIVKAYLGQAWQALQHPTEGRKYTDWDDYVDGEFADTPISLPREKR
jgi:hypothetical protein